MYANQNAVQMLTSVVATLRNIVLPAVESVEARTKGEMCLAILEWLRHLVPIEQQRAAEQAHAMAALFTTLAEKATDDRPQAARLRERAQKARSEVGFAVPATYETIVRAHRILSEALVPTLEDLHELDRQGHPLGAPGLALVRRHLVARTNEDLEAYLGVPSAQAMVGRK
jgi:hypothetical protein